MRGADLLHLLLLHSKTNPNALSVALNGQVSQSQIQKFLKGTSKEPRRTTLEPIAKHFKISVDAFYDPDLAWKTALMKGFLPILSPSMPFEGKAREDEIITPSAPAPIPLRPNWRANDLRHAIHRIRMELDDQPMGVRRAVVPLLAEVFENAQDPEYCDRLIGRVLGVLGMGNDIQPRSTFSNDQPKRQNEGTG